MVSRTAWYLARHGIPSGMVSHGTVSRTAWHPARRDIPHGATSRTAWHPARHGIPNATVQSGPGLDSPFPHLPPGLGSPPPHLHRDWARPMPHAPSENTHLTREAQKRVRRDKHELVLVRLNESHERRRSHRKGAGRVPSLRTAVRRGSGLAVGAAPAERPGGVTMSYGLPCRTGYHAVRNTAATPYEMPCRVRYRAVREIIRLARHLPTYLGQPSQLGHRRKGGVRRVALRHKVLRSQRPLECCTRGLEPRRVPAVPVHQEAKVSA
jgi:hypothetical protein